MQRMSSNVMVCCGKTCREGLQLLAVLEDERLQVDQLTNAFGQCPQAHVPVEYVHTDVKLGERSHVTDTLR